MGPSTPPGAPPAALHVPARDIPAPSSISADARAALRAVLPELPPYPALDDRPAWRSLVAQFNATLAGMIRDRFSPLPGHVRRETIAGVRVEVAEPDVTPPDNRDAAMLFFHGGGLVMGGGECVELFARLEAAKNRCRVYAVDFGNPPDHPYPAGLNDGVAVYCALVEAHRPSRIVVSGASGGGNLAVAVPLKAREVGLPLPAAVGLFTPEVDLTESGDSFRTNAGVDTNGGSLATFNLLYADGHDLADPYVSPLFADFGPGFPPTFIQTGTRDIFLSNAVRLHRTLRRVGIEAELHVGEAMPHGGFGGGIQDLPEDAEIRRDFLRFAARHAGWAVP